MKQIVTCLIIAMFYSAEAQDNLNIFCTIPWDSLKYFRVYDFKCYDDIVYFDSLSRPEFSKLPFRALNILKSKSIFAQSIPMKTATMLVSGTTPALLGFNDGTTTKILISRTGFRDEKDGQYYDFPEGMRKQWQGFIKDFYISLWNLTQMRRNDKP